MVNFTLLLTSSDQEWAQISGKPADWHAPLLVVKNDNFILLLTSTWCKSELGTFICNTNRPLQKQEMPWLPVHTTWQMNLLLLMTPLVQSRDDLNTSYSKNFADELTLANADLPNARAPRCQGNRAEMPCTHYTNLGRWTYFGQEWTPSYWPESEMPCLPVHTYLSRWTWLCPMDPLVPWSRFLMATEYQWSENAISHCYWLVIKNAISHCYWHLVVQMAISHCYWHLVVKNGNFTLLLTSSGQEWQFHIATDI